MTARPPFLSFRDWRQEQQLLKAPTSGIGERKTSIVPSSRVPALGAGASSKSKYQHDPRVQPNPWIDDVDGDANWFSPMEPVVPSGPPRIVRPRDWDYPIGYNLNYVQPRIQLMGMLRGMRNSWGVLSTIIATRQDQLLRIPWTIQRRDKPRGSSKGVDHMRQFFKRPDGKLSYGQWTRLITDDLLVLDAPCIYFGRDRLGRTLTAERIDPMTIFPLIDDAGRRPDSIVELSDDGMTYLRRQPAFQQIIKGEPMLDLDESEIMYVPMRPKAEMPIFGYPGTEQILVEASEAIRKTFYQLDFWAEGTIPDLIVTVPPEWSPRQIAMFQAHFDAMLSGNLQLKSKVRFLPGGMKPFDIKNSSGESLWSQRDETLIRLACYAYSVSPAPFIKMLNRSTAQNAQQMAEEEGLYPLMSFWKDDIMDPIIQERFGYDDVEFVFLPRPEPDAEKQAKIHQIQIKEAIRPRNEIRAELGLEPIAGGDVPMIELGNAVIPLVDAAAGKAMPVMGGVGQAGDNADSKPGSPSVARANAGNASATENSPQGSDPQRGSAKPAHQVPTPSSAPLGKATAGEVDAAAAQAAGGLHERTPRELAVGNYPKGHVWIHGLNISIENSAGSVRGAKDANGEVKWQVRMPAPYGYIRGTVGADGDGVDVYLGKNPESETVWVIDQSDVSHRTGKIRGFDEHKVLLGYASLEDALQDYLAAHSDGFGARRIKRIVELSIGEFRDWLKSGDTRAPIKNQVGTVVLKQKDLAKAADTISASTGLNYYSQAGESRSKAKRKKAPRRGWKYLNATIN